MLDDSISKTIHEIDVVRINVFLEQAVVREKKLESAARETRLIKSFTAKFELGKLDLAKYNYDIGLSKRADNNLREGYGWNLNELNKILETCLKKAEELKIERETLRQGLFGTL